MSARLSDDELRTWQKFQVVAARLKRTVERDLQADSALSEADFTVLSRLAASESPVRPTDLARAANWDTSRLAHQVRRLEARGLVARDTHDGDDRRAVAVALTDAGRDAYRGALGPHLASARRWFADALDPTTLTGLEEALDALASHLDAHPKENS